MANGSLADNNNGTWSYTPDANDTTAASFSYTVTDGTNNTVGSATLGIIAVNDAPVTTPVVLAPVVEDSSGRTITQLEFAGQRQ